MPARVSPERWARADALIADGKSTHEINRVTGISRPAIAARRKDAGARADKTGKTSQPGTAHPNGTGSTTGSTGSADRRRRDPTPRSRRPSRLVTDEQLEIMCRRAAMFPAIPARLMLRCDFCADHFMTTAPELAAELVEHSHDDADLRAILESLYSNWRRYKWAGLAASWIGVPIMHHAAPGFVYNAAAPFMGMPPREPRPAPATHAHPMPAASNGNGGAPPPAPPPPAAPDDPLAGIAAMLGIDFGALDGAQLIAMAQQLGVELPDGLDLDALLTATAPPAVDAQLTIDADASTEISEGSDPAAEPAEAEAEAAEPDPPAE